MKPIVSRFLIGFSTFLVSIICVYSWIVMQPKPVARSTYPQRAFPVDKVYFSPFEIGVMDDGNYVMKKFTKKPINEEKSLDLKGIEQMIDQDPFLNKYRQEKTVYVKIVLKGPSLQLSGLKQAEIIHQLRQMLNKKGIEDVRVESVQ